MACGGWVVKPVSFSHSKRDGPNNIIRVRLYCSTRLLDFVLAKHKHTAKPCSEAPVRHACVKERETKREREREREREELAYQVELLKQQCARGTLLLPSCGVLVSLESDSLLLPSKQVSEKGEVPS